MTDLMKRLQRLALITSLLVGTSCVLSPENPRVIAHECFQDRVSANAFAHFGIDRLIDFSRATGVPASGEPGKTFGVYTDGENRCRNGAIAELFDLTPGGMTATETELLTEIFERSAAQFRVDRER